MRLVFLGAPGAGKGTQAIQAAKSFGLTHLATGDMLREAIAANSPLGKKVAKIVESGALVDDATIIELISVKLTEIGGFILDGFPRTLGQGEALRILLADIKKPLAGVILFNIDEDEILARIKQRAKKEGRSDDTPETFKNRLETYHKETSPLLAFYRAQGLVHTIDGMKSIEAVSQAIAGILERLKNE